MGKDYYQILGIARNATSDDIKRSYRRMALRYHPDKNKSADAEARFKDVSEAYEVLNDSNKRTLYDRYGEEGPRNGGESTSSSSTSTQNQWFSSTSRNPFETFRTFFCRGFNFNNFDSKFFLDNDDWIEFGGSSHQRNKTKVQDEPITYNLPISLEDVLTGKLKKMKITRRVINEETGAISMQDKLLYVNVKKGCLAGTKMTFPQEGDRLNSSRLPADIVFIVEDKPHSTFTREGNNLKYKAPITLREALCGSTLFIPTLGSLTKITLETDGVIGPTSTRLIKGLGLPLPHQPNDRGDLIIEFDIKFPTTLSQDTREILTDCLIDC
ncbi:hypothetical protein HELRODRAFT_156778 [Helobdella robusta]|uniref:J domain-containing protein n=1 Tax=Helobdella robusta TaxID=6412 RepID=T1EM09_HELRO|nr:hypothetical protein HELRODRAFT_156778 [Helobdella robusta]ESO06771.1 hypothetical protein HELRODRAFT_156778 [Helobdella robusta]